MPVRIFSSFFKIMKPNKYHRYKLISQTYLYLKNSTLCEQLQKVRNIKDKVSSNHLIMEKAYWHSIIRLIVFVQCSVFSVQLFFNINPLLGSRIENILDNIKISTSVSLLDNHYSKISATQQLYQILIADSYLFKCESY